MLRIHSAAIGVALDEFAMLPKYKPESDAIKPYGYKILERLLSKNVTSAEIFAAGGAVLALMMSKIPSQEKVEEKEDFFSSTDQAEADI